MRDQFLKDTKKIKNRYDYFILLDSHPNIKRVIVRNHGGEVGFQEFKANSLKSEWRIYRNKKGELAFRPADYPIADEEKSLGERVDELKKSK